MASEAQILANRLNAQKSTGPRTVEGKAAVSQNAVKHGLAGRSVVVSGEDPGQFEFYRERMLDELEPVGEVELSLAERIVSLSWRLKRADKLQAAAFDSLYAQEHTRSETLEESQDADGDSILGRALVRDFADGRALERMLMYERRIEQSLYRTMAELKKHRILAEIGPGKMWELRRVLASKDDTRTEEHARDARATGSAEGVANAIEPVQRADSSLQTSNIELHTSPAPSCKTKPICPAADDGQVPGEEEFAASLSCDEPGETNPMCPQDEGNDATLEASPFGLETSPSPVGTLPCTPPPGGYNCSVSARLVSGFHH